MTKNINRAVSLTSYFITLPPAPTLIFAMLALGFVFGLLINIGQENPLPGAVVDGMMLLALPALLSSIAIKLMIRKMPFRRIAATALCGEFVYSLAYTASLMLYDVNTLWAQLVVMIGSALVFVFWYVIARFVFILKYRSIVFAILQLLFYLIFLLSNQALYVTNQPFIEVAARFYISSFVLLSAVILFFFIINAPMKKSFGVSSTDAVSSFVSQWLYSNKDLEKTFEQVGESARTIMSIMGFRREGDTVFFLTPYVHFGPFGNLGGSEFSFLLAEEMQKRYGSKAFVFHGTVTHDLNPVSSSEMEKVMESVDEAIKEAKYADASVSLSIGQADECRAEALRINNSALIGVSRAPQVTEDINFGLGLAMIFHAEKELENVMLVDQHNAETGDVTSFEPGSETGYRYLRSIERAISEKSKKGRLRLGIATRTPVSKVIGKAGIKVAVFSTEPQYVLVVIDSNGITPEYRDKVERVVQGIGRGMGKEFVVGICTTDTHQTNVTRGVFNPLKDEEAALEAIKEAVEEAVSDMQEAKFFSDRRWFDINVLGAKQSIEIVSTVNSIVAVAKITLPLIIFGALLILFAIATNA